MTSLIKNLQPPSKNFFRVQSTRLANPFEPLNSSLAQSAEELGRNCRIRIYHPYFLVVSATFLQFCVFVRSTVILFFPTRCRLLLSLNRDQFCRSRVSFSSISFVCVQYHRLLACVHSLRQRTCVPLQATNQRQNSRTKQTHHCSTAPSCILFLLFYALRVSSREPIHASFSKGGILI